MKEQQSLVDFIKENPVTTVCIMGFAVGFYVGVALGIAKFF
jgi:ElaB/YqjD/DUF883 family membrane-anchored ribosome-binding protein